MNRVPYLVVVGNRYCDIRKSKTPICSCPLSRLKDNPLLPLCGDEDFQTSNVCSYCRNAVVELKTLSTTHCLLPSSE